MSLYDKLEEAIKTENIQELRGLFLNNIFFNRGHLIMAVETKNMEIIKIVKTNLVHMLKDRVDAIKAAIKLNLQDSLLILCTAVGLRTSEKYECIYYSIIYGNMIMLQTLIDIFKISSFPKNDNYALFIPDRIEIIEYLLNSGLLTLEDISSDVFINYTSIKMMKFLISRGFNVDKKYVTRQTSLKYLQKKNERYEYLLSIGWCNESCVNIYESLGYIPDDTVTSDLEINEILKRRSKRKKIMLHNPLWDVLVVF